MSSSPPGASLLPIVDGGRAMRGSDGVQCFLGPMTDGVWMPVQAMFRLALNGTGTIVLDAKDLAGAITTNVFSATGASAVNQVEFPYAGDSAVQIRATLTGSLTAKVI